MRKGVVVADTGEKMLAVDGQRFQVGCRHARFPREGACGGCYAAVTFALNEINDVLATESAAKASQQIGDVLDTLEMTISGKKRDAS